MSENDTSTFSGLVIKDTKDAYLIDIYGKGEHWFPRTTVSFDVYNRVSGKCIAIISNWILDDKGI